MSLRHQHLPRISPLGWKRGLFIITPIFLETLERASAFYDRPPLPLGNPSSPTPTNARSLGRGKTDERKTRTNRLTLDGLVAPCKATEGGCHAAQHKPLSCPVPPPVCLPDPPSSLVRGGLSIPAQNEFPGVSAGGIILLCLTRAA
jgi:hypothetical protein